MDSKFFSILLPVIFLFACDNKQSNTNSKKEGDSLALATSKIEQSVQLKNTLVHPLTSAFTNTDYDIYVSFPADYKNSGKKYPLLIVLDAEVNFGAVTYIVQRLVKDNLIPELIVVGIAYRGETDECTYYAIRGRDLTPTADPEKQYRLGTGGAENFVKFISEELFPYLYKNLPIQHESKALYVHSFGGLFGVYVLLNHPKMFDNYLLLSPSLWWNNKNIMKNVRLDSSIASLQIKLYMATGALEGAMVTDQLQMMSTVNRLNSKNIKIKSEILDQETHRTVIGRGFTNGLRFLYGKETH
jgi:predicted alpha/beta superfamily hydrolase